MNNKIVLAINEMLTLKDNNTDIDAKNNLRKAQDMFIEYKSSLKEEVLNDRDIKEYVSEITFKKNKWISELAKVISENFSCYYYYVDGRQNKIIFWGREEDTYICNILLSYTIDFIENKMKKIKYKCRRDGVSSSGLKEEYALQFIDDITSIFEEQRLKNQNFKLYIEPDSQVTISYLKLEIEKLKNELEAANEKLKRLGRRDKFNENKKDLIKKKSLQQKENGKYPTVRELAKEFDCSPALICNILNEKK